LLVVAERSRRTVFRILAARRSAGRLFNDLRIVHLDRFAQTAAKKEVARFLLRSLRLMAGNCLRRKFGLRERSGLVGDLSLRLKNGFAPDDSASRRLLFDSL
jgi:hypothetical protein